MLPFCFDLVLYLSGQPVLAPWGGGWGGWGGVLAARLGGRSGRINTCVVEEEDSESESASGSRISHLSGCIRALLVHETVVKKELI